MPQSGLGLCCRGREQGDIGDIGEIGLRILVRNQGP